MKIDTKNVTKKELREFGLITSAILVVLFGLLLPWLFEHALPLWPWIVAAVLALWALIAPATLKPVYRGWMAIGAVLGWINTRIILGIMFFLIFLPVGLILKLFGKDLMARKLDKALKTYRIENIPSENKHVERPY
ncbi:MAG: sxtJ [Thiothrix sp.]|nr:MAG: sxtJ [Thiothrix sp.]